MSWAGVRDAGHRPNRARSVCHTTPWPGSLLEFDEKGVRAPIVEPELEPRARPGRVRAGLPDVRVLVERGVVLKGAASRRDRRLDYVLNAAGAGHLRRRRIARSE